MKKLLGFLTILSIILFSPKVLAAEITSLEASESASGEITIKGSAESSMIAAAVIVYDSTGNTMVTMQTTQINDDNTFSLTINLDAATYVIKAADYNGGDYKSVTVSPKENEESVSGDKNPATLDNIITYLILGIISLSLIVGIGMYFKKQAR